MKMSVCAITQDADSPGPGYIQLMVQNGGAATGIRANIYYWDDDLWSNFDLAEEIVLKHQVYTIAPPVALHTLGEDCYCPDDQEFKEKMVFRILRGLQRRKVTIFVLWSVDSGNGEWGYYSPLDRRVSHLISQLTANESGHEGIVVSSVEVARGNVSEMDLQIYKWIKRHGEKGFIAERWRKKLGCQYLGRYGKKGPACAICVRVGQARLFILPYCTWYRQDVPDPVHDFMQLMAIERGRSLLSQLPEPQHAPGTEQVPAKILRKMLNEGSKPATRPTTHVGWKESKPPPRLQRLAKALEGKGTVKARDLMKKCKNEPIAHIVKRF